MQLNWYKDAEVLPVGYVFLGFFFFQNMSGVGNLLLAMESIPVQCLGFPRTDIFCIV